MKILMIANFVTFPWEGGNSRFTYLLNKIDCKNNEVELVTSNFWHGAKKHRKINEKELKNINYKITLINEVGYKKNVSLKRFYSHYNFSKNLECYLNKNNKPDVIYCAIPSLSVGKVVAKYAKKNNIRFIIDIQDLWPEAFKMVFNVPILSDIIFFPMRKKANYIYSNADEIVAVSETYVNRALEVNKKCKNAQSIFLGTDLIDFDKIAEKTNKSKDNKFFTIAYIGTLGHSYDIKSIIDAIHILNNEGIGDIKFLIMGEGPLRHNFEMYAKEKNIKVEFTGRLKYEEMVRRLVTCDIAVNPITHGASGSIINKVGDYAMAGLPVINTQECHEYIKLIDEYYAGFNCKNGNTEQIAEKIKILMYDRNKRKKMGQNNRKLAVEKFDRGKTYNEIIKKIME